MPLNPLHMRKQLRDAVCLTLSGLNTTGGNVFATRTVPMNDDTLPGICVYVLDEDSEIFSMGIGQGRSLQRQATLIVEAVTKEKSGLDDALDQMALEIESAFGSNPTLGGLCRSAVLKSTKISIRGQNETDTGSAMLTYSVSYVTPVYNPSINLI